MFVEYGMREYDLNSTAIYIANSQQDTIIGVALIGAVLIVLGFLLRCK